MFRVYDAKARLIAEVETIQEAQSKEGAFFAYHAGRLVWKQEYTYQD